MTRDQLSAELARRGLPQSMVCWDGPGIGECYAVEHGASGWSVYYSERGSRLAERTFTEEVEALRYLLGWIVGDNS